MVVFRKYPSIESVDHVKQIQEFSDFVKEYAIRRREFDKDFKPTFMVTEKIHGMNMQVTVLFTQEFKDNMSKSNIDNKYLKIGSRSQFLGGGEETFYLKAMRDTGSMAVMANIINDFLNDKISVSLANYTNNYDTTQQTYSTFKENDIKPLIGISFYGEFYGGSYLQRKDDPAGMVFDRSQAKPFVFPGARRIQKGIFYAPDNRFAIFDIALLFEDKLATEADDKNKMYFIDGETLVNIINSNFDNYYSHFVPIFVSDVTLDEAFAYKNDGESAVSGLINLTLPTIKDNIMEGTVIRGYNFEAFKGMNRVCFKNKNENFTEVTQKPAKTPKEAVVLDDRLQAILDGMMKYITEERVANICSHYSGLTLKDMGKVISETCKDIFDEYAKDSDAFEQLEKGDQKKITKPLNVAVVKVVKEYMYNNC